MYTFVPVQILLTGGVYTHTLTCLFIRTCTDFADGGSVHNSGRVNRAIHLHL